MRPESDQISPTELCPHPDMWQAPDSEASEVEVGDFLHGLIRLTKPYTVLETGCYLGYTSYRMAVALMLNDHGMLYTCDKLADRVDAARERMNGMRVSVCHTEGVTLCKTIKKVDLAFIDSNGDRIEECRALQMNTNGLVVVHDMNWPQMADDIRKLGWTEIFFPTPRGVSLFKP